jgi:hypothetical protein
MGTCGGLKIRRPKVEVRKKAEVRNPKGPKGKRGSENQGRGNLVTAKYTKYTKRKKM